MAATDFTNIISRIFSEHALKYEEIGKGYESVFYRCWDQFRRGEALKQYHLDLLDEDEARRTKDVTMRCSHLIQGLVSRGARDD